MRAVRLWHHWWKIVQELRPAFSRERTFLWFCVVLAGMSTRRDLAGVTSFVRSLKLDPKHYNRLLDVFKSTGVRLSELVSLWCQVVLGHFPLVRMNGRILVVGDGIKAPREGRKMPGVKLLHQESGSNSKPEWIMGHSCQSLAVLAGTGNHVFAVPLATAIHEGVVRSNRDRRTLMDRMVSMFKSLGVRIPCYAVFDSWYAAGKMGKAMIDEGHHLVTRVKHNAVACREPDPSPPGQRGRPKKYGRKVILRNLFRTADFKEKELCLYGVRTKLRYHCIDLIWKSTQQLCRFVLVIMPGGNKIIFMSTDTSLEPEDLIYVYHLRFKIEVTFRQAVHSIGTFSYRFWMKEMDRVRRGTGNQHIHKKSAEYRKKVMEKLAAYQVYLQAATIAHGLLQYLSLVLTQMVWNSFGGWLRTIRKDLCPSEQVVMEALRNEYDQFIAQNKVGPDLTKFISDRRASKPGAQENRLNKTG